LVPTPGLLHRFRKSANALFRFPTTSGWRLPETTLCFLTYTGKSRSYLVTSARFNVITTALSTTLPALSRETYPPCLCFPFFASHFTSEWPFPSPTIFGSLTLFLIYAIAHRNYPHSPHPAPHLAFHRLAHPWLFLRRQLLHTLFASLIVLFLPFSVSIVLCLIVYHVSLRVSSRETIHANFSVGGHSYIVDFTFRITTCRFLLAIVSRSWDLVGINLSFPSRDFVCPHMTSIRIAFGFVHRRGHHAFRKSNCVSLAHGPRWLFLL